MDAESPADDVLQREFDAEDGSFLIQLRSALHWDPVAFRRLTGAMRAHVERRDPDADIPRWVADGFWYASWFIRDWSQHPNFPRPYAAEYYEAAYGRLHDLASWLFTGESPYNDPHAFDEPLPGDPA